MAGNGPVKPAPLVVRNSYRPRTLALPAHQGHGRTLRSDFRGPCGCNQRRSRRTAGASAHVTPDREVSLLGKVSQTFNESPPVGRRHQCSSTNRSLKRRLPPSCLLGKFGCGQWSALSPPHLGILEGEPLFSLSSKTGQLLQPSQRQETDVTPRWKVRGHQPYWIPKYFSSSGCSYLWLRPRLAIRVTHSTRLALPIFLWR